MFSLPCEERCWWSVLYLVLNFKDQVNKTLVEDIERANADLRIAVDASADCS